MPKLKTLLTGLGMGESPRWHDGRLWFSDMVTQQVGTVDLAGNGEVVTTVQAGPMGLGWLPDGTMLVVSSRDGRLLRCAPDGSLSTQADMSSLSPYPFSDLVMDGRGNAYITNIGFDFAEGFGGDGLPGTAVMVTAQGQSRQVADGMGFPNGLVVTPDNSTLILAESYTNRLTAFDIAEDGSLANRRVWAQLGEGVPDGLTLDAENAVWYADVPNQRCVRVQEGGAVLQTIDVDRGCFACVLGGPDNTTLFIVAAQWLGPESMSGKEKTGQVLAIEVDVPGVGSP
ncbi:gluconolaconase [Rhizocola hellebori]|uniref:Gluconolaconase n=1 Tax=Rhizocola hellebori TaxID=1392758 RepID=A0A8J3VLF2_9ACTN|nr:SMP-30/gluconolactonase/LRE family protein [Rhizocola hellebori]GIH10780.1 gluconolaconase [Rhizocola hellebori]